jgi:exocyst complex component 5
MLEKFVNQVQGSTNPSLDSLKKLAGLKKVEKDERIVEPEFIEQDGLLELDIAKRMLKWHAEAIGRAVELTPHSEL